MYSLINAFQFFSFVFSVTFGFGSNTKNPRACSYGQYDACVFSFFLVCSCVWFEFRVFTYRSMHSLVINIFQFSPFAFSVTFGFGCNINFPRVQLWPIWSVCFLVSFLCNIRVQGDRNVRGWALHKFPVYEVMTNTMLVFYSFCSCVTFEFGRLVNLPRIQLSCSTGGNTH